MSEKLMMTYSARIARALKRHNVDVVIGQSNPAGLGAACEQAGIRELGFRAENTGSYMSSGYAIASGKVPVLFSQNGAAATLIVSGLSECLKSSYPVVAIVQDIYTIYQDKNAFQEIDQIKMFEPVAKWVRRVNTPDRVEEYIDKAFVAACSGRPGPAVLLIPSEMLLTNDLSEVNDSRKATYNRFPLDRSIADPAMIKIAAEKLAKAECPFIYAGGGVVSSGASEILRKIQHDAGIPVATSTMGKGSVDETDPLTMGPIGYYMGRRGQTRYMRPMVNNADLIFLIGNRTNQNGTDMWRCLPDTEYIHLDIDPQEIDRNYESLRLCGDAKLSLEVLYDELMKQDLSKRKAKRPEVEKQITDAKAKHVLEIEPAVHHKPGLTRVEKLVYEVDRRLDPDHLVVSDASFAPIWLSNYICAKDQRKFVFPRGMAGIGWGVPMAIGAKIACPDRKVFCLTGDGGFGHAWSELETIVREDLPMVIAVMNNSLLAYQKYYEQQLVHRSAKACDLCPVDHAMIAEACGVKGIRVEHSDDLEAALDEAFAMSGPVLLDVITDPKCVPPLPFMEPLDDIGEVIKQD